MNLKKEVFNKQEELDELKSELKVFDEFRKHLKQGDIIHIPELSYDPIYQGYHPLEVQDTSKYIYCIERSIMKEHFIGDLEFYIRDSKRDFIRASNIKDASKVKEACKTNRLMSYEEI